MIIELSIGNYRSIRDLQTLSMRAKGFKEIDTRNVHSTGNKWFLLKSKAIYGANASVRVIL